MYASVSWINDYLDRPLDADAQADLLTRAGFPLEDREDVTWDGGQDVRQDFEMTSNRGDCTCHLGMAREIAAIGGLGLKIPDAAPTPEASAPAADTVTSVENHDHDACPRYTARIIRGVTVGPSPAWLADRLRARGDVPRNNVVDATNFVLFELGQPTHVFDLAKLAEQRIVVRRATDGESFLPLGEGATAVTLTADDLVIADAERPVALAGVKGGAESAVGPETVDLLLEAATFAPVAVRNASRRHGIASDSSYRFERGVHPAHIDHAADRLAALILEVAGGTLAPGVVEAGAPIPAPKQVSMRCARARALLGIEIDDATMASMLERLGFVPTRDDGVLHCTVPVHRLDIEREIDLIEEVARMHGLDRIEVHDAIPVRVRPPAPRDAARRAVADALVGLGFVETVTHSLVGEAAAEAFMPPDLQPLRVDDERAGAESILRPSVLASLARVAAFNRDHGGHDLRFFEQASTFAEAADGHLETVNLGLLHEASTTLDNPLRETRGLIDRLVHVVCGPDASVTVEPFDGFGWLAPGAVVRLGDRVLGTFGLLSASAAAAVGLEGDWAVAELGLDAVVPEDAIDRAVSALPQFPAIERDVSVLIGESVTWTSIESAVVGAQPTHLESLAYVTTWRDDSLGADRKSVTMRLRFRAADRTLTHDEVDPPTDAVIAALRSDLGAEVRS